jgi:nucleotide-binding universal stress UspA family protein
MTIIAAVADTREGRHALAEALDEARLLSSDLVVVNLGTTQLDLASLDADDVAVMLVDRTGKDKDDSVEAVLDEIEARGATRLVIGVRRRTPVGKALLGSLSQHLLLHSPVSVLAVKLPEDELPSSAFDRLPAGMQRVTG